MPTRTLHTYAREELKQMIVSGDVLVLHRSLIYRLNGWLKKHPGGELVILHFVGRDATDELEAYHSTPILKSMKGFVIGQVSAEEWGAGVDGEGWHPIVPPIQAGLWPVADLPRQHGRAVPGANATSEEDSGYSSGDSEHRARVHCLPTGAPDTSKLALAQRLALLDPPRPPSSSETGFDVSPARQHHLSESYKRLHVKVKESGFYTASGPFFGYGRDLIRWSILFGVFLSTSVFWPFLSTLTRDREYVGAFEALAGITSLQHFTSAVFLGLLWHQLAFAAHDAGHTGVTGKWRIDRFLGIFIADFIGGLSIGWWCDSHDVHHLVTNHPEHDPDIQHIPFFAISTKFFGSLWSTYYKRLLTFDPAARFFIQYQHKLYYLIMMFGRFNLCLNSYTFLLFRAQPSRLRNLELVGVAFYWTWFGTLLYLMPSHSMRILYVLVSFAVTSPLHVQIVLSHFSCSTVDLGLTESFAHRQLRTTMDVTCPSYLDFLHGGLHMQVTHHLFPRIPRHNLRRASALVQKWCKDEGVEYRTMKFVDGNRKVLGILGEVAKQVSVLSTVAEAQAKGELDH